ncbi:hypothetical protein REJC140_01725 [Pseudorhizobium endolithicum]|uniref:Uncharacterized protein n=1 Tax=Pseudorhizobium endolithicum TaxID=1191678 RepID=A0ABN7JW64_9HYPH|nr:hypothetical protein [Pseudorhizobium endolithicum]CAD6427414.1 hypothetical protein REQ54_03012 [Rhizobium sp. Q54]CAD7051430.1 hypothetical protein REJC140_01725 [Pseudorhizobium endolithicum]
MIQDQKTTQGANDRSRNDTIAQSGPGIPDDGGQPVDVDEAAVERARTRLAGDARADLKREVEEQIDKPQRGSA